MLTYKWRHFSQPTKEEKDRLEWIFGADICRRIIQAAEIAKHENKQAMQKSKNIAEYIEYLKRGNIGEFELSLITYAFKLYNNNKTKNVVKVRSPKKDIQEYFNIVEKRFKEIESDFANNVKDIQIKYKQTIEKYRFVFQHILNHVCPLLLMQFGAIKYKSLSRKESEKRFKLMEMVYAAAAKM